MHCIYKSQMSQDRNLKITIIGLGLNKYRKEKKNSDLIITLKKKGTKSMLTPELFSLFADQVS